MHDISDARANVVFCPDNYGSFRDQALQGLRFSPKPLCAVWEAHGSDVLREMALGVPFLAGWWFLGTQGCCSPRGCPRSARGFRLLLNSSPANAADVFQPSPALQREIKINDLGLLRAQLCVLLDTLAPPHGVFWLKSGASAAPEQPRLGWVMGVLGHTPRRGDCSREDV